MITHFPMRNHIRLDTNYETYEFDAVIQKVPDIDGAYVEFPYNAKAEFGKGGVKLCGPLSLRDFK